MIFIEPTEFGQIVNLIDAGNVVALPTDTIYGLVCKFDYEQAIEKIYQIKNRPLTKPLPILVANWEQARKFGIVDDHLIKYLEAHFLKGQVTVIVKKQESLNKVAYWKQWDSVAIRVTTYPLLKEIINTIGPLVATSCNVSGSKPINDASKINLPFLEYIVKGKIAKPAASTIYDSFSKQIVRY